MAVESAPEQAGLSTANAPLMELRGVNKYYGALHALTDVDFIINAGEIQALVGDNGAGKSTLVKTISGAHQPDTGSIYFKGVPVTLHSPEEAISLGIATVYQDLALVGTRDIANNLFLGREPTRWGMVDRRRMVEEALKLTEMLKVDIPSVEAKVGKLSGGQRQAVAIGRAVHEGRSLLLLDEPTAALGVKESHQMLSLIETLRDAQKAVLIVSHNLLHVFRIADRITVLRAGQVVGSRRKTETTVDEIVKMITGAELL